MQHAGKNGHHVVGIDSIEVLCHISIFWNAGKFLMIRTYSNKILIFMR
ncbi:hypothetical protein X975_07371, partial [Stegodyphus mimosarum]